MSKIDRSLLSSKFAQATVEDLSEGLRPSLSILTTEGSNFILKRSKTVVANLGNAMEVVILRGAQNQSKQYWPKDSKINSGDPPICWSSDGRVPDATVEEPQARSCGMCPHNILKVLPTGFKGKECADRKRLAVVPADDVLNEEYGGPMLFSVPPASLGALEVYGKEMKKAGVPFYAYTTIIRTAPGFRIEFEAGRPVNDDEADHVNMFRESEGGKDRLAFILSEITPEETEGQLLPISDTKPRITPGVSALPRAEVRPQPQPQPRPQPKEGAIEQALSKPAPAPISTRTVKVPEAEITGTGIDAIDEMFGNLIKE